MWFVSTIVGRDAVEQADTLIGVFLAICGNILISFALNIQKLAHNQLSEQACKGLHGRPPLPAATTQTITSTPSCIGSPTPPDSPQPGLKYTDGYSKSQQDPECLAQEEYDTNYLRSKIWWLGIALMVVGEIGNFMAYGFAPASTIAPLGTTTLVSNAILAPVLLDERFRKQDFLGIIFAILGAASVVSSSKSHEFKLSPELVAAALMQTRSVIFYAISIMAISILTLLSPMYGARNILIDLGLVAFYGAYTVVATKGLSSLLSMTLYRLFTYAVSYVLLAVLVFTALMQVKYLNRAMQRYDSTAVIPTQFVLFTISAIAGSAVIYRDFDNDDPSHLYRFVLGCLTEFLGIFLITSGRDPSTRKEDVINERSKTHVPPPLDSSQPLPTIVTEPPTPTAIHITTSTSSSTETNRETDNVSESTPLLYPTCDGDEHRQRSVSSQRSLRRVGSIFRGISLHSQLAGEGLISDDDRTTSETSLSNDTH
ncbi:duf803 domain membrane protein [Lichtheimia corymbifera JMRC:FSU:9682]|uniref:Duf803 domain membrane protein n=1 Tax=Lichtheimia corymbifera JMRC:FSU:9682 TaxID=1263082 RepID=A0A068SEB4_9FUNG|nr:duf803 domain membrane protein [Lichtheimia corymbifera JMRC:FSU:9682]CDH61314.1 duf803 domain membrane protein [Lichtheimia corymbifera JMRC:FSU:9682]